MPTPSLAGYYGWCEAFLPVDAHVDFFFDIMGTLLARRAGMYSQLSSEDQVGLSWRYFSLSRYYSLSTDLCTVNNAVHWLPWVNKALNVRGSAEGEGDKPHSWRLLGATKRVPKTGTVSMQGL